MYTAYMIQYVCIHTYIHIHTYKHTNIQTYKHTNKQTNKQTSKQANKQTSKQTNRQTDKQTNRQTDKQTNRQTNKQTLVHTYYVRTYIHTYISWTIFHVCCERLWWPVWVHLLRIAHQFVAMRKHILSTIFYHFLPFYVVVICHLHGYITCSYLFQKHLHKFTSSFLVKAWPLGSPSLHGLAWRRFFLPIFLDSLIFPTAWNIAIAGGEALNNSNSRGLGTFVRWDLLLIWILRAKSLVCRGSSAWITWEIVKTKRLHCICLFRKGSAKLFLYICVFALLGYLGYLGSGGA